MILRSRTPSARSFQLAFEMVDMVNYERLCWANDFPHSDATWPHSQKILVEHAQDLTEHQREKV